MDGINISIDKNGEGFGVHVDSRAVKDLFELEFDLFARIYLEPAFAKLKERVTDEQNWRDAWVTTQKP